nr:translation initiation factor IF-2-like [Pongo pygmaeus]
MGTHSGSGHRARPERSGSWASRDAASEGGAAAASTEAPHARPRLSARGPARLTTPPGGSSRRPPGGWGGHRVPRGGGEDGDRGPGCGGREGASRIPGLAPAASSSSVAASAL